MNEYETQANKFLKDTNTEFKAEFFKHGKHFQSDTTNRDIYNITLKRGDREYKFKFGQSVVCSGKWTIFKSQAQGGNIITNNDKEAKKYTYGYKRKNEEFSEPNAYDVLSCLQKYDVEDFKFFCDSFGYDEDSIKAEKTYKAVLKEYENMKMLYSDKELETMQEIQ